MKERPILFNTEMVEALLAGNKTQTRRVIKCDENEKITGPAVRSNGAAIYFTDGTEGFRIQQCRYGVPGDQLWVREKWNASRRFTGDIDYDLNPANVIVSYYAGDFPKYRDKDKWKPSIHMHRISSRIQLEVTSVRVEQVQDISEEDAEGEGITHQHAMEYADDGSADYVLAFWELWDSINEKRGFGWKVNPWVWVVEFEVIKSAR